MAPVGSAAPAYDKTALSAVQRDEVNVATTDFSCSERSELNKIQDKVEAELAKAQPK